MSPLSDSRVDLEVMRSLNRTLAPLGEAISPIDVAAAADNGDGLALKLLGEAGEALGIAASWLVNLFDPRIVVGGGLGGARPESTTRRSSGVGLGGKSLSVEGLGRV